MRRYNIRWSQDELVDLLSQLDFVIDKLRKNSGRDEVLEELKPRLIKIGWKGKKLQSKQIDKKLIKLLNRPEDPKEKQVVEIYRFGSRHMESLDNELRVMALERLQALKNQDMESPRQLRKATRQRSFEPRQTPSKTMRNRPSEERKGKALVLVKSEAPLRGNLSNRNVSMIPMQPFLSCLTTTTVTEAMANSHQVIEDSETSPLTSVCTEDLEFDKPNSIALPILQGSTQSFFYKSELKDHLMMDQDDQDTIHNSPHRLVIDDGHETLQHLLADIAYYREKWTDLNRKHQEASEDNRLRRSLELSLNTPSETIKQQNNTILGLQLRLESQKRFLDVLKLEEVDRVPLNTTQIKDAYHSMKKLLSILSNNDVVECMGILQADESSDDVLQLRQRVPGDLGSQPIGLVIQSFTGAALCEWVFNSKLQCMATIDTPLLAAYRSQISKMCGDSALQNIDIAAHQRVIEDDQFQKEFLPRLAADLTERLLNALYPVMRTKLEPESPSWRIWRDIFLEALKIKTFGMVGKHIFEAIWPRHNSPFADSHMVEVSLGHSTHHRPRSEPNGNIMLVLVPGLRVYRYDRTMVDYYGFVRGDEQRLKDPKLMAAATVLTQ